MKTYAIELQHIRAASNNHGLVRIRVDATVQATVPRDDDRGVAPTSMLSFTIEDARVLQLLLKAQLAEVDSRKARSQR